MKVVVDVNNLLPFKMTVDEIIDWSRQIDRIAPELDLKALRFLMDAFATEAIMYDKTKGIQNIFAGLKCIRKTDEGYKVIQSQPWL